MIRITGQFYSKKHTFWDLWKT